MTRYQSRLFNWIDNSLPAKLGRKARDWYEQIGNPIKQTAETIKKSTTKAIFYPVYILASATNLRGKSKTKEVPLLLRPVQSLVLWIDNSEIFAPQQPPQKLVKKAIKTKYKAKNKTRYFAPNPKKLQESFLRQNQTLNLYNSEADFNRVRQLIKDAIAYFFGKKPRSNKLKPPEKTPIKSVKNKQPWLTMKDVFDDDATVWPPQNIENNSLAQSGIGAIANYKSTNQSLDIPSNGITPNSAQELVNATPQATESSRPMYAWIETQATFLGYISNPFGQFIEWLDQLIANVERWIINLWQKIWGLFSNFKKNK